MIHLILFISQLSYSYCCYFSYITVEHIFKNRDDARAIIASDDLPQAMTAAGVLGKPQIWLTEKR